jgi:hypothetical protein
VSVRRMLVAGLLLFFACEASARFGRAPSKTVTANHPHCAAVAPAQPMKLAIDSFGWFDGQKSTEPLSCQLHPTVRVALQCHKSRV